MPLYCDQPSLSFTASANYTLLPSLHQRQRNSYDKIQNAAILSEVALGVV